MQLAGIVKKEIPNENIKSISLLQKIFDSEGAIAVFAVKLEKRNLVAGPIVLVKVPTIEGTELWLAHEQEQEEIEKQIGFQKKSKPLLILDWATFGQLGGG